ncbi:UviB-like protein, partial [Clostridium bornimense]|uniref:BhlA/UviB family holin-like peptide n=1 Tax=Clostridium bornimense TaxID=1216932 RepID=UPI001C11EFAF
SQGIWTILSFFLIYYVIKVQEKRELQQSKREDNYQLIITQLTDKFELINSNILEIKNKLNI